MPHDPQPPRDLHSLVGLGRHATIDELRWAYEKAMAVATRSGNHDHAVRLSRAYDALSGATRRQVYDARGALRCAAHRELDSKLESVPTAPRLRRYRSSRLNLSVSRAVAAVLSVLAVVLTAVVVALQIPVGHGAVVPPGAYVPAVAPAAPAVDRGSPPTVLFYTPPPARSRLIPGDAPVNSQGFVTILCQPGPGSAGYAMFVRPDSIVSCANGALPVIIN